MEKCETCAWWIKGKNTGELVAQCRFNPPVVLMTTMPVDAKGNIVTSALQGKPAGVAQIPQMHFPVTAAEEGCGRHRARDLQ